MPREVETSAATFPSSPDLRHRWPPRFPRSRISLPASPSSESTAAALHRHLRPLRHPLRSATPLPLKAFRKQSRPRRRPNNSPSPHKDNAKKDKKAKAKARKRRRAERAADADGERSTKTEVTVIDTSIDGWKAAKLLVRKCAAIWKVRDKKASGVSEPEDLNKGTRRAGLVSKMQRDREKKKKEATLQHPSVGNNVCR